VIQSDPTDYALATIASILDPPETRREPEKAAVAEQSPVAPPPIPMATPPIPMATPPIPMATPPIPMAPPPIEAHGYSKFGPGPMAAIRFKWTVRLDNGDYYVDETIGENSAPIVTGPMSREAAIQLVDDRESDARRRFEQLKREMMTGRGAAADLARQDSAEA
jgi:hypothetical protein